MQRTRLRRGATSAVLGRRRVANGGHGRRRRAADAFVGLQSVERDVMDKNKPHQYGNLYLSSIVVDALKSVSAAWRDALARNLSAFNGITEAFESVLEGYRPLKNIFKYFREFEEKFQVTSSEAVEILIKYKWLVTPSFPLSFFFQIIEIARYSEHPQSALNRLYKEYFVANEYQNLVSMVERWEANPIYSRRMKIFRDCVGALKYANNRYNPSNLIIPTLIAQIDGLLTDFMEQRLDVDRGKKWKDFFRNQTRVSLESIDVSAKVVLLDILFQTSLPGRPLEVPFTFNRHKIMHGEYTRYGRFDNLIRAFLVVDFISYL